MSLYNPLQTARRLARARGKTIIADLPLLLKERALRNRQPPNPNKKERYLRKTMRGRQAEEERDARIQNRQRFIGQKQHRDRQAWKARADDWLRGPLAANRDGGHPVGGYGALPTAEYQLPELEKGKVPQTYFREQDRFTVVDPNHREYGKIGIIKTIDMKSGSITATGVNQSNVIVPPHLARQNPGSHGVQVFDRGIPFGCIKLVAALQMPGRDRIQDVIVDDVETVRIDKKLRRIIKGSDPPILIPDANQHLEMAGGSGKKAAKIEEEKEEEPAKDYDIDTTRLEVEQRTWRPTLFSPPMPPSVLDELRNKYSLRRIRHDPEYIQQKWEEYEGKILRKEKLMLEMLTPEQLRQKSLREAREKLGEKILTKEALVRLGAYVAAHKSGAAVQIPVRQTAKKRVVQW